MQYTYGAIFLLSLALIPLYFVFLRKKQHELWLLSLCVCVSVVNLGYTLVAFAGSIDFAIFANKVTYLGQVMMPLCMFMIISKYCGYAYRKWVTGALIGAAVLMLAIVCTTGYLDWYYTDVTIETVAGATVLRKQYGILHPTNLCYVIAYFVAMIAVLCVSLKQRKGALQKHAGFMLAIVLGNIGLWCIQKIIPWDFELLSGIYPVSALAFLFVWYMPEDYVHKRDVPEAAPAVDDAREQSEKLLALSADKGLTQKEREVLELMMAGQSRKEMAAQLHVSENTIKTHVKHIYEKLEVGTREEISVLLQG